MGSFCPKAMDVAAVFLFAGSASSKAVCIAEMRMHAHTHTLSQRTLTWQKTEVSTE